MRYLLCLTFAIVFLTIFVASIPVKPEPYDIFFGNREKRDTDCWSTGFGCIDGGCKRNGGNCGGTYSVGTRVCRCTY